MNTVPMRLPARQAQARRGLLMWLPLALLTLGPVAALAETYESESIAGTQASAQASADGGGTRVTVDLHRTQSHVNETSTIWGR